eukprot:1098433-Prymnesium_polylepis.1
MCVCVCVCVRERRCVWIVLWRCVCGGVCVEDKAHPLVGGRIARCRRRLRRAPAGRLDWRSAARDTARASAEEAAGPGARTSRARRRRRCGGGEARLAAGCAGAALPQRGAGQVGPQAGGEAAAVEAQPEHRAAQHRRRERRDQRVEDAPDEEAGRDEEGEEAEEKLVVRAARLAPHDVKRAAHAAVGPA